MSKLFFSAIAAVLLFSFLGASQAQAINMELGLNYSYKKDYFDSDNNTEQQSSTGTLSFYFWERVALELSYTNGLYVKKEKEPNAIGALEQTTTQFTDVLGADFIFLLADQKATFQPFLKAGAAYVRVKQAVQYDNGTHWEIIYSGPSPSYGAGFKLFLTDAFAFRASYDALQTPANNDGTQVTEITGRVGISWMF